MRAINYHTCMFEGSRRKKFQVLITNRAEFERVGKICKGNKIFDRTGEPHLKWRPVVHAGKVMQFTTGDEREYPEGFCSEYAECMRGRLEAGESFVETFSGPNAPLSLAVAKVLGIPLRAKKETNKGVKTKLQHLSQLISEDIASTFLRSDAGGPAMKRQRVENSLQRAIVVEAGKQPGYGKRIQLIPDGIQDPLRHLEAALTLEHPFESEGVLKDDHHEALEKSPELPGEADRLRLETLGLWKSIAKRSDVRARQDEHERIACQSAKRLGRRPRTALMEYLQDKYYLEDSAIPTLCLTGIPIVGEALRCPFFTEWKIPSEITLEELLATAKTRRRATMNRVRFMSKLGGDAMAQAIHEKTMKEVKGETMSGPWSHEELIKRHGQHYNVIPSFGLAQGLDDSGAVKYRRIDDHSAGMTNAAATRTQKIDMAMTDYLIVMIKALHKKFQCGVHLATEDLKSAYRQVPLPDKQVGLSITAVMNPTEDKVELYEIYGQPFGAGHAVPNFYRVAEWLSRLLIRAFSVVLDHFFDDYFLVERPECSAVSAFCISESIALLGFLTDPDKSQVPAEVAHVLGVQFNCAALRHERLLRVQPKPTRKANFNKIIQKILDEDFLPPSLAASVVGKFGFLCSTLFGKVGRACTSPLRERQYGDPLQVQLIHCITHSLLLMRHIINVSPSRSVSLLESSPPFILYTDASDVPERNPRFVVGGVLIYPPLTRRVEFFIYIVPPTLVAKWLPKQTYM